jgi:hypothetical protein
MFPQRTNVFAMVIGLILGLGVSPVLAQKPGKPFKSPLKNFTVTVPALGMFSAPKIEEDHGKDSGSVAFHGDDGSLLRIDYARLPAGKPLPKEPSALREFYSGAIKWQIGREKSTGSVLSEEEYVLDDAPMVLSLVSVPSGSRLLDTKTGKRRDSVLGVLTFARGEFLYMLYAELGASIFDRPGEAPPGVEELSRSAKNWLPNFYRDIKFQ